MFKCLKKFKKEPKEIRPEIQNILDDLISNHDKWVKSVNRYVRSEVSGFWICLTDTVSESSVQHIRLSTPYDIRNCEKVALARAVVKSMFLTATAANRRDNNEHF